MIMNKIWKRVILFAESNKPITTAYHSGCPISCNGNKFDEWQLGLVSIIHECLEYVFTPCMSFRGKMLSNSSFTVMFLNTILMKTHNCAISTESVDSSN